MSAKTGRRREGQAPAGSQAQPPLAGALDATGEMGEQMWIDVIRKMDQVYSDLLQYEVALEEKNAALEESHQFIFSVLSAMSDILVVCDRDGRVEEVNQSLSALTGRSEADLRGKPVSDLFAGEEDRRDAAAFLAKVYDETVHDCEIRFRSRDGTPVHVSLNCTPRHDQKGRLMGMVAVGRPVGEIKRAYEALRQAHDDLKRTQQQLVHSEKMASLGLLVAGVAHELNNPISFVLGNVHALQRYSQRLQAYLEAIHGGSDPDRVAELRRSLKIDRLVADLQPLIDGTIEGAERTRDIVAGLKRFSAADRDENQVFDLRPVLEQAVHWVARASKSRASIVWDLPERIPVVGSTGQLQQVAVNLAQNALDATAEVDKPRVEVRGWIVGGQAEIAFRDNGPGIDPTHLKQVFDPFFTTKPVGKGTGLGLSISYGIVERHGGKLSADNHPEGGAIFTLRLPVAEEQAAP